MIRIRAELSGSDRCSAEGITASAPSPVLAICRKLVEAGFDPATPLEAYRGDVLALRVRSIGEGARLEIGSKSGFAVRTASPAGYFEGEDISPAPDTEGAPTNAVPAA